MKKLFTIFLMLTMILSPMVAQEEEEEMTFKLQGDIEMDIQQKIQQEISSEMDEVKMWMKLYKAAEDEFIDIASYPEELNRYMLKQAEVIEKYLELVDEAEALKYDGGDWEAKIKEAKGKLQNLKILRQIFDEYVEYKNKETSPVRLAVSVDAIKNNTVVPRMHKDAYTVMRGEYPIEVNRKVNHRIKLLNKYEFVYRNGDTVTFQRNRLISIKIKK